MPGDSSETYLSATAVAACLGSAGGDLGMRISRLGRQEGGNFRLDRAAAAVGMPVSIARRVPTVQIGMQGQPLCAQASVESPWLSPTTDIVTRLDRPPTS